MTAKVAKMLKIKDGVPMVVLCEAVLCVACWGMVVRGVYWVLELRVLT